MNKRIECHACDAYNREGAAPYCPAHDVCNVKDCDVVGTQTGYGFFCEKHEQELCEAIKRDDKNFDEWEDVDAYFTPQYDNMHLDSIITSDSWRS